MPRDGLVGRLLANCRAKVVVLAAPCGYGKTATVLLWDRADERSFVWVQVQPSDDDAAGLLRHIALSLHEVGPLGPDLVQVLTGPRPSASTELLPPLGRELAGREPLVLVLDELHLLRSPAASHAVAELSAWLPPGSQLVLISRGPPPPGLARFHMTEEILEIGVDDLAMPNETARQLLSRSGVDLDDDTVADLVRRTEGWAGGLHLAGLALSGAESHPDETLFAGGHRLVADYLFEEVLDDLPDDLVTFLEESSVLDRMSGPLLDDLLETHRSAERLRRIEQAGAFLIPLDERRGWCRYHQLFGEMLRDRLWRRDPERARDLERRAVTISLEQGDVDAAIRHAVRSGDASLASELILRQVIPLFAAGRAEQLEPWLLLLGPDAVDDHPGAALAWAWLGLQNGDAGIVRRAFDAVGRVPDGGPQGDGSPSVSIAAAAVRAVACLDGLAELIRDCELVRGSGGPSTNPWWVVTTLVEGSALVMLGNAGRAEELLRAALERASGLPAFEAVALAHLALLALDGGDPIEADRLSARALQIVRSHRLEEMVPIVAVFAVRAVVAADRGHFDEADEVATSASRLLARLGDLSARTALYGYLLLARTGRALGRPVAARSWLEEAERARRRDASAVHLVAQLEELERATEVIDLRDVPIQSLTAAEHRVLVCLPTHLSLQEIADRLVISRNTVKTHSVAIYRKLGVSSRSEAVEVARRCGYLPSGASGSPGTAPPIIPSG